MSDWIGLDWMDWMGYPIPLWHQEHRSRAMLIHLPYIIGQWKYICHWILQHFQFQNFHHLSEEDRNTHSFVAVHVSNIFHHWFQQTSLKWDEKSWNEFYSEEVILAKTMRIMMMPCLPFEHLRWAWYTPVVFLRLRFQLNQAWNNFLFNQYFIIIHLSPGWHI